MSSIEGQESPLLQPQWEVEDFFFGAGEWSTYRRSGERIQYRVEKMLPLTCIEGTNQYNGSVDDVAKFLTEYEDCQFLVADSYELKNGGRQAPYLLVMGWKDLPDDERYIYEEHKVHAWKKPSEE